MVHITSPAFAEGGTIPVKYTCDGENIHPPITFNAMPVNTASLAIIMDDPDAPMGTWTHWLLWNIDPMASVIAEGEIPVGAVAGYNTAQKIGYAGPCPPSGTHQYFFRVYALDTRLNLPPEIIRAQLEDAMRDHIIERGELMGRFGR